MELRGAIATHVGNVRDNNQDRAFFGGLLAAVADGMGGHQGGEMAATIAISRFIEVKEPVIDGGLVQLVEDANRAVFEQASDPDLRGMGTTLVAMALMTDSGMAHVVNVGDSRTYYVQDGAFAQLTIDHSLVEDLVRQKRLTPKEAENHPQRNILTRALGIAPHVEVDRFKLPVKVGTRFLLCSDGLFNEVSEQDIHNMLVEIAEPNEAADSLVAAALASEGRDNITVAVVDVVDAGQGEDVTTDAETSQLVSPIEPSIDPSPTIDLGISGPRGGAPGLSGLSDGAPEKLAGSFGAVDVVEHDLDLDPTVEAPQPGFNTDRPIRRAPAAAPEGKSGRFLRGVATLLGVVVVGLGAYIGLQRYASTGYFVTEQNGTANIMKGQPGGFLIWQPKVIEAGPSVAGLTEQSKQEIEDSLSFGSAEEAQAYLNGLAEEATIEEAKDSPEVEEVLDGVAETTTVPGELTVPPSAETPSTTAGA